MDAILPRATALFQDDPLYWSGVVLWLLGFAAYVPAAFGRGFPVLTKTGAVLCWLGFAITLLAQFVVNGSYRLPPFGAPTLDMAYWLRSSTQILILWILSAALVIGSGLRWFTARIGWLGLTIAMVGVIASWFATETARHATIQLGTAIVSALLILLVWRGDLLLRSMQPGE